MAGVGSPEASPQFAADPVPGRGGGGESPQCASSGTHWELKKRMPSSSAGPPAIQRIAATASSTEAGQGCSGASR
ncbi:MAG TPA: hypothetical protein VGI17_05630 [Solirubrobacterales bacterium]|jgi:hypothetical protein